ncbi:protein toll isoform X2 [Athalia rosae]|nr:protein toll isoform X2 [Athalia rosae]
MGKNNSRWLWLLILIWAGESLQELCRESEDCSCEHKSSDEYEMRCPKDFDSTFIIEVKEGQFASVKCNMKPSWSDFKLQSTAPPQDVEILKFEKCPLPGVPLHEITQRIGLQPTKNLRFESYLNLSSSMDRSFLTGFPTLEKLSLNSNGLTELPADLLNELPELEMLELRENNVVLPPQFFNNVPKLRTLELGHNKMTHVDPMLFQRLTRLGFLSLWGNQLVYLEPHTFETLAALQILNINNNVLKTLPQEIFKQLKNLTVLNIASNLFSSLPEGLLSQNHNLTNLRFSYNRGNLTTIPNGFLSNLTELREVQLIRNNLIELPEDILWGSFSIRNLILQGNYLTTLPKNIFKDSKNLRTLDLSWNKITSLPDDVFRTLDKLEKLDLRRNQLATIQGRLFSGLSHLVELNLQYNGIRIIDSRSFYPLESLEVVRLSHNQITFKDDSAPLIPNEFGPTSPFERCSNLRELDLSFNNVTEFFSDWQLRLHKLAKLDLKYNQITYVTETDFQFLSPDIVIDITNNNISHVQLGGAELVAQVNQFDSKSRKILVEENPIICDCNMFDFLRYLGGDMHPSVQKMFHIVPGNLKCAGPEWMRDTLVSDLKYDTMLCSIQDCPQNCTCWFRPNEKTIVANCSNRNLIMAPERIFASKEHKVELDLTGNLLTTMPTVNQSGYGNLTKLFLSHNNISSVSLDAVPLTLEILELHQNNLMRVDPVVIERFKNSTRLTKITLHGNPWKCDCEARDLLSFIQMKFQRIPQLLNITCGSNNKPLSKMTANDLCPVAAGMIVGISFAIAIIGISMGILAALYYKYRTEIKIWLYSVGWCLWFVTEEELDKDKLYDAFISYSHKDEDFVVNELLSKLEGGPKPFKLCLHFRDWLAGEWIPAQIARSVENSRRTVVILSPNFLESVWGRMEFRVAHNQALSEGRARVILILYGDIGPHENLDDELKAYMSMNTYVKWGDPWFWDKLRYALPHQTQEIGKAGKKIFDSHPHHIQITGDKNGLINPPGGPITPPPITTPPADSLKIFETNGSLHKGIRITDCLKNEMSNFDNIDMKNDHKTNKNDIYDNNVINGQCMPV